jgi:hypothetical protein
MPQIVRKVVDDFLVILDQIGLIVLVLFEHLEQQDLFVVDFLHILLHGANQTIVVFGVCENNVGLFVAKAVLLQLHINYFYLLQQKFA